MLCIGCSKCGDKRPLTAWALEAGEMETRNPSKLDMPIACYRKGCRMRHAHLVEATPTFLTLPGERKPSKVVTYKTVSKRVTVRQVLSLLRDKCICGERAIGQCEDCGMTLCFSHVRRLHNEWYCGKCVMTHKTGAA